MNPVTLSKNRNAIVYDADRVTEPEPAWFDPGHWEQAGAVTGRAPGRGTTLFVKDKTDAGIGRAVLRRYLRGGWPSRISRDRYLFTGVSRSRPFREFHLLGNLSRLGLPVPAPLAALCRRRGFTCTGALLMSEIAGIRSLLACLPDEMADSPTWQSVGACIRDFHRAGVDHADLNAGNILVEPGSARCYLVDFDRCRYRPGRKVDGKANLSRLKRSLLKQWPVGSGISLDACWRGILDGYHG